MVYVWGPDGQIGTWVGSWNGWMGGFAKVAGGGLFIDG